jgi:hypothetical protein
MKEKKLRTIDGAYKEIVEMDPNTAITKWAIRRAVSEGYVPSRRVGKKYLFNLDTLLDYFDVKVPEHGAAC